MKHTKHILLMAAMLLGSLSVSAYDFSVGGIYYNIKNSSDFTVEVTYEKYEKNTYISPYSGDIEIPKTVISNNKVYFVTSIGEGAFYRCRSLTSITLPRGVTSIGRYAFEGCSSLEAITLPESVTSIENYAFYDCSSLTSINLPESVTSIGEWVFSGCSTLASISIPKGVTNIEWATFKGCSSLTSIDIPESVTSIGGAAFSGCGKLSSITIPKGVTSIEGSAFYDCSALTSISIPEGVTSIGGSAFYDCSALTSISIPEGVTSIESHVFHGCSSLSSIVIPKSVVSISGSAFAYCSELLNVHCYAVVVPSTDRDAFDESPIENVTLHVPLKSLNDYNTTAPWSSFGKFETIETPVSSITLSKTSLTLTVEDVWQLSVAEILPENATDKSVVWSSRNPNVVAVAIDGRISAIAPGSATITATANDGSGVSASCEVTVVEDARYSLTFMVDGEVFQTKTSETPIEVVFPEAPEKKGYSFVRWELGSSDAALTDIDIANNADEMLYTNAPCTNTQWGDQFTSWDVLFDDDYNTFFHSEYSEGVDSEDGEHHYLRVDMGEGNAVSQFTFSYAMRGGQYPNHTPTEIIVEGSNEAFGKYEVIAVLTDLVMPPTPTSIPPYKKDYTSEILGNGNAYRYIRYRVTETYYNDLVCGHPYFYISEFGMKTAQDCYNAVYHGVYAPNKYKVYYYVGEELLDYVEVTYGDQMPNMGYFPALDTEEFLGWVSETGDTYETMPAHDVVYVANIRTYEKCATPTIRYADGRVTFLCETEGVVFTTQVIDDKLPIYRTDSEGFEFVPTYTFTTYATKEGCIDSDEVSVTICWIDCTGEHEVGDDESDIISIPSQPVIIQCANGVITLTGLADGTAVAVYDTAGMELGTAEVQNGVATIATNLSAGSTAIVTMGNRSVKVVIK